MRAQKRALATGVVLARKVISGVRRFSPDVGLIRSAGPTAAIP